jgi:hypothetical protein
VLHAEPPAQSTMARIIEITAKVEVRVEPDGSVSAAHVFGRVPFVAQLSENAACQWQFAPSPQNAQRSYVLNFEFAGVKNTDEPSHWEVTSEDALTLRMQYCRSTVSRLDRDRNGQVPAVYCRRHGIAMDIVILPIHYGLPASLSSDALRKTERVSRARRRLFPEANLSAAGGGCMVQPEKTAEVHSCAECRQAREEWFRRHPDLQQYE